MNNLLTYFRLLSVLFILCSGSFAQDNEFQEIATVQDERINESSGLAASRNHRGSYWIHNDSGDVPRLFLVASDGHTQAVVNLINAEAHDWEDMCSFSIDGESWLLIGDIGDNGEKRNRNRRPCTLYLLNEPEIPQSNGQPSVNWRVSATILFEYDDGAHNCESVAVDVEREEILLVTKTSPRKCGLYTLPLRFDASIKPQTAKRVADPFLPYVTGMDIAPDGRSAAIASMLDGIIVRRKPHESWSEAFRSGGQRLPLPKRKQGETICYSVSGQSLFVNSEKTNQPLWKLSSVPETEP